MLKKILRTSLAVSLVGLLLESGSLQEGKVATAAAAPTTTKAPVVMTDNLSKYGLEKEVTFPLTTTVNGLSYTIHKMMIYDIKSADAQALMKKYKYPATVDYYPNAKYFIWTKISIVNNSKSTMGIYARDTNKKWKLVLDEGKQFEPVIPMATLGKFNSKEALWDFILKPGEKLDTYQAFEYDGSFKSLRILMTYKDNMKEVYIANSPK
ncbi:hypothetical protein MKY19_12785 [Paenibacillus sp. FSL R5-0744]|uniref:hypothetical protein n=1 Tax=Paenibacillus sp. FSL R5-0744 TaxID=2921656 RepID=UPI0030DA51CC